MLNLSEQIQPCSRKRKDRQRIGSADPSMLPPVPRTESPLETRLGRSNRSRAGLAESSGSPSPSRSYRRPETESLQSDRAQWMWVGQGTRPQPTQGSGRSPLEFSRDLCVDLWWPLTPPFTPAARSAPLCFGSPHVLGEARRAFYHMAGRTYSENGRVPGRVPVGLPHRGGPLLPGRVQGAGCRSATLGITPCPNPAVGAAGADRAGLCLRPSSPPTTKPPSLSLGQNGRPNPRQHRPLRPTHSRRSIPATYLTNHWDRRLVLLGLYFSHLLEPFMKAERGRRIDRAERAFDGEERCKARGPAGEC